MGRLGVVIVLVLASLAFAAAAAGHPEPGDIDGDGVRDEFDNCVQTRNADQGNADLDRLGDRCDTDADADGHANTIPYLKPNPDNCPLDANPGQEDTFGSSKYGDACEVDADQDGVVDPEDNCPNTANGGQADYDYDRTGDVCDPDDDEDGDFDAVDNCPLVYNWDQADLDRDGLGSACDASEVGSGPGGPGGPAGDRTAPRLRLRVATRQHLGELGSGLAVEVRCSEACAVVGRLTIARRTARRLGMKARTTTVAGGSATLAGRGRTYVFLRFRRGMARRLGRGPAVSAKLALRAADAAGNARRTSRKLRLMR